MGISLGITMAGKMLAAGYDAAVAQTAHPGGTHFDDLLWSPAKRTISDNGTCRVRIDVEHGRDIEVQANNPQLCGGCAATLICYFRVSGLSDGSRAGKMGKRLGQPVDPHTPAMSTCEL